MKVIAHESSRNSHGTKDSKQKEDPSIGQILWCQYSGYPNGGFDQIEKQIIIRISLYMMFQGIKHRSSMPPVNPTHQPTMQERTKESHHHDSRSIDRLQWRIDTQRCKQYGKTRHQRSRLRRQVRRIKPRRITRFLVPNRPKNSKIYQTRRR